MSPDKSVAPPKFGRNRMPTVRALVAVIAIIPDTPESRQALRDTIESAVLAKGVALQGLVSKYEDPQTGEPVPEPTGVADADR